MLGPLISAKSKVHCISIRQSVGRTMFQGRGLRRINLLFGLTAQNWFKVISLHVASIKCKRTQWFIEEHRVCTEGNDNDDDDIKVYGRKTTSSSSFPPLLLNLSHDDLSLFYWCWTSTIQSCWVAMKTPWAIAPKAVKRWWKILYIQKCLNESYTNMKVFLWE